MKLHFLILIALVAVIGRPALPQQPEKPLTKSQIMELVKAEMDNTQLAKLVRERGIDFEPTDDDVQALRKAGAQDVLIAALHAAKPQPLTRDQVLHLVAGGVPSERAAALVKQRGIAFLADEEFLSTLRLAGADDTLIAAVREASAAATAPLAVETSPNAEVFLDGQPQGHTNAQGDLTVEAKLGPHALKVSLAGKKDFEQNLTLAGRQATQIEARLVDLPGSIRLQALAGARVTLDNASRGSTDANGELVLTDVPPGSHHLRVTAHGKKDYERSVSVLVGQETEIRAPLEDVGPLLPGTVRENPRDGLKYVWIPPGTFMMGCSRGDGWCHSDEKPSHEVTISEGFWIGQTEVSVGAYKRFAAATGRQMPSAPAFNSGWENDNLPIVNVSWYDAHGDCTWAGGRLPTEAEWEYAARGGSTEASYGPIDEIAWTKQYDTVGPHEVAKKRANGFGLFDVLGNVDEWVNDWFDPNYYQKRPSQDPSGPASGGGRVIRGESWGDYDLDVRVSSRRSIGPGGWDNRTGFRCGGEVFAP
jgi:formylglycine-generating enzyme required for sulfatase activity